MLAARAAVLIIALFGLAGCFQGGAKPPEPKLTLLPVSFAMLTGWSDDNIAGAVPAFLKSCGAFLTRGDTQALDAKATAGDFGTVGEWRGLCDRAAALPSAERAAKDFFETNFVPMLAGNLGDSNGRFTGYFEIALNGSRRQGELFQTPIYRHPPNPAAYSRAEIEDGALAHRGLELAWVDDPVGAFFLAIQGSGQIRLKDGGTIRVGYDGANGRPNIVIGRLLVERGEIPLPEVTMDSIRAWITAHGAAGVALMRENPSYVFFKEIAGDGPLGSEGVVLTARRSLAVDRVFIPLGMPIWLDAQERFLPGAERGLVIAQDTGGAIKGPVRGDLFWGSDAAAAIAAGRMNAAGRYYLLLPKTVAARVAMAFAAD
jgi:membrane-bound lytic murein transglycosylase A